MCVYARASLLTINKGVALLSVMNTNTQIHKLSQMKKTQLHKDTCTNTKRPVNKGAALLWIRWRRFL